MIHRTFLIFWVLATLLTSGCSFILVHGAPARHEQLEDFDCMSSRAPPVLDSVVAAAGGTYTAVLASSMLSAPPNDILGGMILIAPILTGAVSAVFASSAVSGFFNAASCAEAKELLEIRQTARDCKTDQDCKGDHVCFDMRCVTPPAPVSVEPYTPWG